jgi:hypothetical protein
MNADGVGAELRIRRRGMTLPRLTLFEWLVAMQTTFGTLATGPGHVLDSRMLVLTIDDVVLGARLVLRHTYFSIERNHILSHRLHEAAK